MRYLDFNEDAKFRFVSISFINLLRRIFIEFKYLDDIAENEGIK